MSVPEEWTECQKAILAGVNVIPKTGIPGTIIAFGDNAIPVLTGDDRYELIITASQCKNGKIIVFSHNSYVNTFHKTDDRFEILKDNVKKWASNGRTYDGKDDMILFITEHTTISELEDEKYRLFIWGCQEHDEAFTTTMIDKVKEKGVGLIMGHCPWGWQQLNNNKPLDEAKFYPVLLEAGVCFTGLYVESGGDRGFRVENNKANAAHVGQILTTISKDLKSVSKDDMNLLQVTIPQLPDKVWRQLSLKLTQLLSSRQHKIPKPNNPITEELDKLILKMQLKELMLSACEGSVAPGCKDFPGNYSEFNDLVGGQATLRIRAQFDSERLSTGYYLPAGWRLVVAVQQGDNMSNWSIRIGAHSDELHSNEKWTRWPKVCMTKRLEQVRTELVSPFGGLVYFENHKPDTLEVTLENVLETPYYDLTNSELCSTWKKRRNAPGLWAELAGETVIFTLPSSSVREMSDPASVLRLWDKVIFAHNHLKGFDPLSKKRERVVCDVQPSVGYMHAGYPIVTHLDITEVHSKGFVMSADYLRNEGNWGLYHEIGHNMQDDTWTFGGTVEVTCNVFTLHAMQTVSHKNPGIHLWLQNQIPDTKRYLENGANFQEWKENPGVALFVYAQLVNAFGWTSYKAVFRRYKSEKPKPDSDQDKIDLWFSMFSECVTYNLAPMAVFWGIPLSTSVSSLLEASGFIPFLPNDEITSCKEARGRVWLVEEAFSSCLVRVVDQMEYCSEKFEFKETDPVSRNQAVDVLSWSIL